MAREHFDAIAPRYDALRTELFDEALALLVREVDLPGHVVLDLGCGTGRFAAALADEHGCTAIGVDPSPGMLAVARERSENVTWFEGRAEQVPLADDSVERAFMQTVVHLVEDRAAMAAELRRVLARAGRSGRCRRSSSRCWRWSWSSHVDALRAKRGTSSSRERVSRRRWLWAGRCFGAGAKRPSSPPMGAD